MKEKEIQIASVKLTNGGMKGIEVEYLRPSVKGNVQFFDTYKSKRKAPIHQELEDTFSWCKSHLLDICGYTLEKEEREYLMGVAEVTGVKYGDKGIVLFGDLLVLGGTRVLKLETPLITDEVEYPEFGKLKSIIDGIYTETKEYMAGKKVMSNEQIILRANKKNEEFDFAGLATMSKEEQREMATKILEDQGCMVFHNDEFTTDEAPKMPEKEFIEKATKVVEKEKAVKKKEPAIKEEDYEDFSVSASRTPEPAVAPSTAKAKPEAAITLTEDEGDFALPLVKIAPKKSTAKLKAK